MSSVIRRTQERYFEILEDFFGDQYKKMKQTGKTPREVALEVAKVYSDSMVKTESDQLLEDLNGLWMGQIEQMRSEIRGIQGVKAFYGGSMTPTEGLSFAKKAALYVDTTIIADPASSLLGVRKIYNPRALIYALTLFSLNMLEFRDLTPARAEVSPLTIVPSIAYRHETERRHLKEQMDSYTIGFYSEVLSKEFVSIHDLRSFVSSQGSLEGLLRHLTQPGLLSDPDRNLDPSQHVRDFVNFILRNRPRGSYGGLEDPKLLTDVVLEMVGGQMGGFSHILYCCRSDVMRAEPVTDLKLCWGILNWIFRHDSAEWAKKLEAKPGSYGIPERKLSADASVLNVLMRDDFRWLGNVPNKDIARLREKGELEEIRDMFSDGIREMGAAEPDELDRVVEQVKGNWNRAVDKHKKEVRKLRMDAGLSAGAVIVGTLGVIVPVFSPFAIAGAGIGAAKLARDMAKLHEQRKRPVGILLKAYSNPT